MHHLNGTQILFLWVLLMSGLSVSLFGPALVQAHEDKGQDVHRDEIIEENLPEDLGHMIHLVCFNIHSFLFV